MNTPHKSIINIKEKELFELLTRELVLHGVVKVTGLGVFRLKKTKEHSRYIPGKKKIGVIKSHIKLCFVPTKSLKVNVQAWK